MIKEKVEITDAEKRVELLEVINEMAGELVDLENAEIIVSGGRGVGGPEGFAPVRELAEVLGATVGASRAAVDAGWMGPHSLLGKRSHQRLIDMCCYDRGSHPCAADR